MKVKNLIELLQQFDPETNVVRPGYEGGYQDICAVSEYELALNVHSEWWYGPHEDPEWVDHYEGSYNIEKRIIID